jgi:hypothetical protein
MNSIDKITELQRIISTAQDDLAVLMKKGKRFKPEFDGLYWFIEDSGQADCNHWTNDTFDVCLYENFNCYETEELATKAAKYMKRNNAITTACLQVDPEFVPDYLSGNQEHYSFYYQSAGMGVNPRWVMSRVYDYNRGPCVSTEEKWEEAAALLTEWGIE